MPALATRLFKSLPIPSAIVVESSWDKSPVAVVIVTQDLEGELLQRAPENPSRIVMRVVGSHGGQFQVRYTTGVANISIRIVSYATNNLGQVIRVPRVDNVTMPQANGVLILPVAWDTL